MASNRLFYYWPSFASFLFFFGVFTALVWHCFTFLISRVNGNVETIKGETPEEGLSINQPLNEAFLLAGNMRILKGRILRELSIKFLEFLDNNILNITFDFRKTFVSSFSFPATSHQIRLDTINFNSSLFLWSRFTYLLLGVEEVWMIWIFFINNHFQASFFLTVKDDDRKGDYRWIS